MNKSKSTAVKKISIEFRAINDADLPFLRELYGSTRSAELAMLPWSDVEKKEFVTMQFNAQHTFYQEQFDQAEFNIVIKNTKSIGRLYLDHRCNETRIIDIAILPKYQRMGIGKKLLTDVIDSARQRAVPVSIHVEKNNPAMSLYQRLGFKKIEDQGVYDLMECSIEP